MIVLCGPNLVKLLKMKSKQQRLSPMNSEMPRVQKGKICQQSERDWERHQESADTAALINNLILGLCAQTLDPWEL